MLKRYLKRRDNPWEILAVGALFFFPGLFMLLQHGPMIAIQQGYKYTYPSPSMGGVTVISEHGAHVFGSLAVAVAVVFVWFYFYLRRVIRRDPPPHVVEHGHDRI